MTVQQVRADWLPRALLQLLMLAFLLTTGQAWFYHDSVTTLGSANAWFLLTNTGAFVLFLPGLALFEWGLWSGRGPAALRWWARLGGCIAQLIAAGVLLVFWHQPLTGMVDLGVSMSMVQPGFWTSLAVLAVWTLATAALRPRE